jgi:hypothetical protein
MVIRPTRVGVVTAVEFVKVTDRTVPAILAMTIESP